MLSRHSFSRSPRAAEWSGEKAVTFIVTLAASANVTLAAARAGMSRKSAYALKSRDPAFAAAWTMAARTASLQSLSVPPKGDKGNDVHTPPVEPLQGDKPRNRVLDEAMRDSAFAAFVTRKRDLAMALLADAPPLP